MGGFVAGAGSAARAQDANDAPQLNVDPAQLLKEPNVCRGLNMCQGKGKGDHDCAGKAACTTVAAHSCAGENDCKGQGGCGGYPGQNTCDSKGKCAVPLKEQTWTLARKQFEELMKDALIDTLRRRFETVADSRRQASCDDPMADTLMSAFAMFATKAPFWLPTAGASANFHLQHHLQHQFPIQRALTGNC